MTYSTFRVAPRASWLSCVLCIVLVARALGEGPGPWAIDGTNIYATNSGSVGIGTGSPGNKLEVAGDLGVSGDINFPGRGFRILGGGALEWPGRVRFGAGGDGPGLPAWQGKMRAQPGSNLEILPLKDYARSALDIYPTTGKKPDFDALAELTIHRFMPSNQGHEMLSISALASVQDKYGVIVEAHGTGHVKPLDFMVVQGGLLEGDKQQPFWAQVMRMKTDGTMQFGPLRTGSRNEPVDIISIEQDELTPESVGSNQEGDESDQWKRYNGPSNSHFVRYTAKEYEEGRAVHRADWRTNVHIDAGGASSFVVQSRRDDLPYEKKIAVHDNGDIELPVTGAVVLTSPNGKKWRVTVANNGQLHTSPAE